MNISRLTTIAALGFCLLAVGVIPLAAENMCTGDGCSDECKTHNRWCYGNIGRRYEIPVVESGCSENPPGGDPDDFDTVAYDSYNGCTEDCPNQAHHEIGTGAPSSLKLGSSDDAVKTVCYVSP